MASDSRNANINFREISSNKFEFRSDGQLLVVEVRDGLLHIEHGPENETARSYHTAGGVISVERFMKEDLWQGKDFEIQIKIREQIVKNELQ